MMAYVRHDEETFLVCVHCLNFPCNGAHLKHDPYMTVQLMRIKGITSVLPLAELLGTVNTKAAVSLASVKQVSVGRARTSSALVVG